MNKLIKSAAALMLACAAFSFTSCDDESDVIGLNDLTKYGFIKVTIDGTRPDGEEFSLTRNFKFASSTGPEYSSTVSTGMDGDIYRDFEVIRYGGAINEENEGASNYAYVELDTQEGTDVFTNGYFSIYTPITTDDKKFFYVNENFNVDDEERTNYSYNEDTGKFTYKFSKALEGSSTGYPMTITVSVNATVFERIEGNL